MIILEYASLPMGCELSITKTIGVCFRGTLAIKRCQTWGLLLRGLMASCDYNPSLLSRYDPIKLIAENQRRKLIPCPWIFGEGEDPMFINPQILRTVPAQTFHLFPPLGKIPTSVYIQSYPRNVGGLVRRQKGASVGDLLRLCRTVQWDVTQYLVSLRFT